MSQYVNGPFPLALICVSPTCERGLNVPLMGFIGRDSCVALTLCRKGGHYNVSIYRVLGSNNAGDFFAADKQICLFV